ncbi:kinase domain protein (macronuclear) [Tetrahymena thermophila SB210]|uniref:Kinase domain protein n=1 Tax=Tetrahymena thermophila (strain SB210) TaxID=312017 RepID=Q24FH3_TETTS|nr:kinase domain protein [Tetrahymena thermophila SB210]EAS06485.2 kinase domain protein [Tetrahymena thermophila SB210]|eukprot:XP_001026730.2 kinase domain protein [Tetrahymena thermophila SB210]
MSSKINKIDSLYDFLRSNFYDIDNLLLEFKGKNYDASQAQMLGKQLEKYKSLEILKFDLSFNKIRQDGALYISQSLSQSKNLQKLIIILSSDCYGYNYIGEVGAQELGIGLAQCSNLEHLEINLRYNSIGSTGVINLAKQLKNCISLQSLILNLKNNSLFDKGAIGLAEGIGECSKLSDIKLYLKYNNIGNQACYAFGIGLSKCKSLKNLFVDLSGQNQEYNRIADIGAIQLGLGLSNCLGLNILEIKLNQQPINQEGASGLLQSLNRIKSLRILTIHFGFIIPMVCRFIKITYNIGRYKSPIYSMTEFLPNQFRRIDNQGAYDIATQLVQSKLSVVQLYFKETINPHQIAIIKSKLKECATLVDLKVIQI